MTELQTTRFNRDEVYFPEFRANRRGQDETYLEREKGWPCPGYTTPVKVKPKQGNGLKKHRFRTGESKRGWAPDTWRKKEKV